MGKNYIFPKFFPFFGGKRAKCAAGYANMTRTPNIHTIILSNSYTRDHVRNQIFADHFSNG